MVAPLVLGTPAGKDQVERSIANAKRFLGILNKRLGEAEGGWLAAGCYTIADVAHIASVLLLQAILGEYRGRGASSAQPCAQHG